MTRDNFKITYNGQNVIKHKWNSSIRETERLIGEIARQEGTIYELTGSESIKGDYGFVKGSRTWEGRNGNTVTFNIEKQ